LPKKKINKKFIYNNFFIKILLKKIILFIDFFLNLNLGSTLAKLIQEDQDERHFQYSDPNQTNLIAQVSVKDPVYFAGGPIRVVLVDFGVKNHIIRCLLDRGVSLLVVPWNYNLDNE
jgi:carbamoyl-phosphate synthase small subunit